MRASGALLIEYRVALVLILRTHPHRCMAHSVGASPRSSIKESDETPTTGCGRRSQDNQYLPKVARQYGALELDDLLPENVAERRRQLVRLLGSVHADGYRFHWSKSKDVLRFYTQLEAREHFLRRGEALPKALQNIQTSAELDGSKIERVSEREAYAFVQRMLSNRRKAARKGSLLGNPA